jgi:2-(1,2-epoxy-1,2-dihydrophenyl)acetyl-CoA isomerase
MKDLLLDVADDVAVMTLNRAAARNALSRPLVIELVQGLAMIRSDPAVRVLVLTGAGNAFCAGGDVREMAQGSGKTTEQKYAGMDIFRLLAQELHGLDKPVIAAVDGVAFGAGFSLALLADIVLASEAARFCMVFHRIGLIPDIGALYTLPRVVGLQRAKEIIFSAREFGARDALAYGIALEVLPRDELMPRALELATSLASSSPTALSISKRALQQSLNSSLDVMLQSEACGQPIAVGSDYAREAVRRFSAKEPPVFQWPIESNGKQS